MRKSLLPLTLLLPGSVCPFSNLYVLMTVMNIQALESSAKCQGSRGLPRSSQRHGTKLKDPCSSTTRTGPKATTSDVPCEPYSTQAATVHVESTSSVPMRAGHCIPWGFLLQDLSRTPGTFICNLQLPSHHILLHTFKNFPKLRYVDSRPSHFHPSFNGDLLFYSIYGFLEC